MLTLKHINFAEERSELDNLPAQVTAVMEVDLAAITHNYRFLCAQLDDARCAAVVKADAYGLGVDEIAPTLANAGCNDFFVASIDEGINVRKLLPKAHIYVLNGLLPGSESILSQHNMTPILNDIGQIIIWQNWSKKLDKKLPAIIHLDSGMWRAGLPPNEVKILSAELERLKGIDVRYYMSHLACSDQATHPKNIQQLQSFQQALKMLPSTPASIANSHGIFLGPQYHFDLVRPGRSLYGIGIVSSKEQSIKPTVKVSTKVIQVSDVGPNETIGYEALYRVAQPTRLATLAAGYTDGLPRTLDGQGTVFIGGIKAPIIGGVSMDLLTIDVSKAPENTVYPGAWAEIIGEHISADDVAANANRTTSREVIVNLGKRYHRVYKNNSNLLNE